VRGDAGIRRPAGTSGSDRSPRMTSCPSPDIDPGISHGHPREHCSGRKEDVDGRNKSHRRQHAQAARRNGRSFRGAPQVRARNPRPQPVQSLRKPVFMDPGQPLRGFRDDRSDHMLTPMGTSPAMTRPNGSLIPLHLLIIAIMSPPMTPWACAVRFRTMDPSFNIIALPMEASCSCAPWPAIPRDVNDSTAASDDNSPAPRSRMRGAVIGRTR
jgi:hypothetical protein